MEYRRLGKSGLKVSTICLGTMQFGWSATETDSFAILDHALELGCNFIDTADVYSSWAAGNKGGESEEIIGRWLTGKDIRRHGLIVATKVRGKMGPGPNDEGLSRGHIMQSVEASLRRLQTDYIDLYQVHWPDEETPLEETVRALDDLIRSGKVRYIGCSNYPAWLLTRSLWISDVNGLARFETLQPHYSYVHRAEFERELRPLCIDQRLGVIPYSPLGGGFLTGKYRRDGKQPDSVRVDSVKKQYFNDQGFMALEALEKVGQEHGATIAQTAVAWMLADEVISSVIIGANTLGQLTDTMMGADVHLSPEEKVGLDKITDWAN
jgi:aryl-alcohol dehydrogenase-like predicted oxidoreductase